jgi:hypothetical protein
VTLFELILVLVLLVVIGALAWPALDRPLAAQRLRNAGDQVRTAWAKARNQAMTSGDTCLFYYQSGGNLFYSQQAGEQSAFASSNGTAGFGATMPDSGSQALMVESGQLPDGVVFAEGITAEDPRVAGFGAPQASATAVGPEVLDWSLPVAFFPDGTATTTQLILTDKFGSRVLVELRGLTGSSAIGDVYSEQQVVR